MKSFKNFLIEASEDVVVPGPTQDNKPLKAKVISKPEDTTQPDFNVYKDWFTLKMKQKFPKIDDKKLNDMWKNAAQQLWKSWEDGAEEPELSTQIKDIYRGYSEP